MRFINIAYILGIIFCVGMICLIIYFVNSHTEIGSKEVACYDNYYHVIKGVVCYEDIYNKSLDKPTFTAFGLLAFILFIIACIWFIRLFDNIMDYTMGDN